MRLLLDTHLVLWAALWPDRLSVAARVLIDDPENLPMFSVVSIWEVAIKKALKRQDFTVEPALLRRNLLDNGYSEIAIVGAHVVTVAALPPIHKDPVDRMLVAQAMVEGAEFLTADLTLAGYPASVRLV